MNDNEYLFTSESVTEGHPDKVADQISDGVLDAVLRDDPGGRVAGEKSAVPFRTSITAVPDPCPTDELRTVTAAHTERAATDPSGVCSLGVG